METDAYTRLTGFDGLMLRLDRGSIYNHTLKIIILDPSSDPEGWSFQRYREMVEHYVTAVPMWRTRYVRTPLSLHQPVWVHDPDFDLDVHMRRIHCPQPGGMTEFCALVEQIYAHPLDHSRPLWQVWAVEGLEGGRVALLNLIHHAYTDGVGMVNIIERLTTPTPVDTPKADTTQWRPAPLPSAARRLRWAVRDLAPLVRGVGPALKAVRKRRRLEQRFAAEDHADLPSSADIRRPQIFGGHLTRSRRFACESFSFAEINEVRTALGGTANDVFLSCVSGAVRRFLLRRDEPCCVPVVGAMAFLTKPVSERGGTYGGNFSSPDGTWLHPEIADPLERLAATTVSAGVTKDHFKAVSGADPSAVVDLIPAGIIGALLRLNDRNAGRYSPVRNIVVSNVPGPREPRYFGRWRMDRWFSTGQLVPGATLNFTGWSYSGQFNLCVISGSPDIPDAWELMAGFRESLAELVVAARRRVAQHDGGTNGETA
jgi:WS/DGAT/MGAT family acyltransferase